MRTRLHHVALPRFQTLIRRAGPSIFMAATLSIAWHAAPAAACGGKGGGGFGKSSGFPKGAGMMQSSKAGAFGGGSKFGGGGKGFAPRGGGKSGGRPAPAGKGFNGGSGTQAVSDSVASLPDLSA